MTPHARKSPGPAQSAPHTVGTRIRALLAARKWTQVEAAAKADLSPQRLHDILSDRCSPTVATLERLAAAWGVGLRRLLP